MSDAERRVEYMDLDALQIAARNPKAHAVDDIQASFDEFGYIEPIVVDERTGKMVAGHGRRETLLGAKERGEPPPGGVVAREGRWMVPVLRGWASTDDRQAEKALLAFNRLPEAGGWNEAELVDMLQGFEGDLEGTGYDAAAVDALAEAAQEALAASQATPVGATDPDDVPVAQPEPRAKRGEVWILGQHRVLCGDATSRADVETLMAGETAALMNTDPPYGDAWVSKARDMARLGYDHSQAVLQSPIEGDEGDGGGQELMAMLDGFLAAIRPRVQIPFPVYVWHGGKRRVFEDALERAGIFLHQSVIWLKPGFVIGRLHYHPRHESALHGWIRGPGRCPFYGERNQSDVWEAGRENDGIHPTQKPVALFERPMLNHTKPGEICYEPFSGSGSQIIAGEKLGRRVFAMEIAPAYVDVAIARWERFTGKIAQRAG